MNKQSYGSYDNSQQMGVSNDGGFQAHSHRDQLI
jgi:hypothetical protein